MPTENARHASFHIPSLGLWFEAPLCVHATGTLDCSWARLGCAPADLDGSGTVDEADMALFEGLYARYGWGARCNEANRHCDGADLDRSGSLNREDRAFMEAAQGCMR